MTPVWCCGFECGVDGTGHLKLTNASFDTGTVRTGARSLRCNPTAAISHARAVGLTNTTVYIARAYLYFATLPSTTCEVFTSLSFTTSKFEGAYFKSSDSKIYAGYDIANLGATGVAVTTGQWYLVDIRLDARNNPTLIDVQVDGVACGQATQAVASENYDSNGLTVGIRATAATADVYCDDWVISQSIGDYPIGAGHVNHFVPTSDGTHQVAGAADFKRTLTGTDILNATTDAYTLVDDVPLESGASVDWINMVAPPNATDYVECVFGPAPGISTPTVAPRAVEVIAGIHQAGTGTGNMEIRINDNGTTDAMYTATTVAGVTSVAYKRKHYATNIADGGAWTVAAGAGNFNNLRVQFGSPAAVDANPDQYFDCIMVEAEFAEVAASTDMPAYFLRPRFVKSRTRRRSTRRSHL